MKYEARMVILPEVQQEGLDAAVLGTHMSTLSQPIGFTFNPYGPSRPAEHWNFLTGCVNAYFEAPAQ